MKWFEKCKNQNDKVNNHSQQEKNWKNSKKENDYIKPDLNRQSFESTTQPLNALSLKSYFFAQNIQDRPFHFLGMGMLMYPKLHPLE